MRSVVTAFCAAVPLLLSVVGCAPITVNERNAFATFSEVFGIPGAGQGAEQGLAGGVSATTEFRRRMLVTLTNNHPDADLNTSLVAWVNLGSIRDADQQDALLRDGYVALAREIRLGTTFTLPAGTFVFNGPGVAGASSVTLGATQTNTRLPSSETFDFLTPDVVLVFSQPPVSCESVAFSFTRDGEVVFDDDGFITLRTFGEVGFKTLAQVDVYDCQPLRPGLFLKTGGGTKQTNEYFEGENVTIVFNEVADADGHHANVTIGP